jgi:hypothetical protein
MVKRFFLMICEGDGDDCRLDPATVMTEKPQHGNALLRAMLRSRTSKSS